MLELHKGLLLNCRSVIVEQVTNHVGTAQFYSVKL